MDGGTECLDHEAPVGLGVVRGPDLPHLALKVEEGAGEGEGGPPLTSTGLGRQLRDAFLQRGGAPEVLLGVAGDLPERVELLDLRSGEIVAARDSLPTQESLLGLFVDPVRREFSVLGNSRIFRVTVRPGGLTPGPSRQARVLRLDPR